MVRIFRLCGVICLMMMFSGVLAIQACSQTSGTLIVLNKSEATASLISLETGITVATVPTGDGPHEVAVSPDGQIAVVTNYGVRENPGSTLTVIDLKNQKVVKTIDLVKFQRPHGLVFFPDGERLLVTAEAQKKLLVVNVPNNKVIKALNTDQEVSHMVVFVPRVNKAFVANIGSGSVTVFDMKNYEVIKSIETGAGSEGLDVSPDGKEVWVTNRAEDSISIIDTQSLQIIARLESKSFPIRIKFMPDGKQVLVSNARSGDIAVFNVQQRKEVHRIAMDVEAIEGKETRLFSDRFGKSPVPVGILIHPNGQEAYVANTNADIVTVIDLQSLKIINRLQAGKEPDGLGFTPLQLQSSVKK